MVPDQPSGIIRLCIREYVKGTQGCACMWGTQCITLLTPRWEVLCCPDTKHNCCPNTNPNCNPNPANPNSNS